MLSSHWNRLGHPRILVIGDLMLDRYVWGEAQRISPEAPVLVLREDLDEVRPGGAANVASFLRGFDVEVVLAGVIGDDSEGRTLLRLMTDVSVNENCVIADANRQTTTKQRFVGRAAQRQPHQILRVDRESCTPLEHDVEQQLIERILSVLPTCDAVLISDYAKGVCTTNLLQTIIEACGNQCGTMLRIVNPRRGASRHNEVSPNQSPNLQGDGPGTPNDRRKIPVLIDPSRGGDYRRYAGATLIKPNRTAATEAIKRLTENNTTPSTSTTTNQEPSTKNNEPRTFPHQPRTTNQEPRTSLDQPSTKNEEPRTADKEPITNSQQPITNNQSLPSDFLDPAILREYLHLDAAIITLDRDGIAYATADDSGVIPCRPREVCDVTGAGDMVLAVLGLCLASDVPLVESLHLANAAAGLEVERFGVEALSRADVAREIDGQQSLGKLVTLEELVRRTATYRRSGLTIVFTNGCFDLLHVGHVSLLEEAARIGDVLIVAINSDASVRRLKGAERPIIGEDDRARMLGALACVDHVLIFDDDTPHRLLEALRPDVLVKGGTTGHIVGHEVVKAYGGRVMQTSTIAGLSTTQLVQRMKPQRPLAEATS